MGMELIREILLWTEENAPASFSHGDHEVLEDFNGVEYDMLDSQLMNVRDSGLLNAQRTSGGWFIQGLTLPGQEYLASLESPAPLEALIEVIREASERAEFVAKEANEIAKQSLVKAQEANEIATGANTRKSLAMFVNIACAVISSGSLAGVIYFWMSFPKK